MGYKPIEIKKHSLNEIAGNETVTDSRGRAWGIRVYTLGELDRFHAVLTPLMMKPCVNSWARFLQANLRAISPGLWVRLRRAAGLPDCSARRLARCFTIKGAAEARDMIVRANLDMSYEQFASRCIEIVKKKTIESGAASAAAPARKSPESPADAESVA